jgi:hypothetical protein
VTYNTGLLNVLRHHVRLPREPDPADEEQRDGETEGGHVPRPPRAPGRQDICLVLQRVHSVTQLAGDGLMASLEVVELLAGHEDRSLEDCSGRGKTQRRLINDGRSLRQPLAQRPQLPTERLHRS